MINGYLNRKPIDIYLHIPKIPYLVLLPLQHIDQQVRDLYAFSKIKYNGNGKLRFCLCHHLRILVYERRLFTIEEYVDLDLPKFHSRRVRIVEHGVARQRL